MNHDDIWDIKKDNYIEIERKKFKLNQIKLEHFYFYSGEMEAGMPLSTSIELKYVYNYNTQSIEWKKIVVHNYANLEDSLSKSNSSYEEVINDGDKLISNMENYDLRELKNNYFNDDEPERFTHWELTYNNNFKIVGTYDNEILEFVKLSEILNFKKIMNEENDKVKDKMASMQD